MDGRCLFLPVTYSAGSKLGSLRETIIHQTEQYAICILRRYQGQCTFSKQRHFKVVVFERGRLLGTNFPMKTMRTEWVACDLMNSYMKATVHGNWFVLNEWFHLLFDQTANSLAILLSNRTQQKFIYTLRSESGWRQNVHRMVRFQSFH